MGESEAISLPLLLVIGFFGMLILAVGVVVFFVIYQKRILQQQQRVLQLESEYQKDLLASSIQTQESERQRIASDLHDSVGSLLSVTKMYLKKLKGEPEVDKADYLKNEAFDLVEETISNIRNITRGLIPVSLERFGLAAAVEDLVKRVDGFENIDVSFSYSGNVRFDSNKEMAMYRIIQELLNNTLKHAEAKNVQINLEFKKEKLYCTYIDDGKGFDWKKVRESKESSAGLGLKSIESRINFLNGKLNIQAGLDKGFHAEIDISI